MPIIGPRLFSSWTKHEDVQQLKRTAEHLKRWDPSNQILTLKRSKPSATIMSRRKKKFSLFFFFRTRQHQSGSSEWIFFTAESWVCGLASALRSSPWYPQGSNLPSSVSGRTEAVKRGLQDSSIFAKINGSTSSLLVLSHAPRTYRLQRCM